MGADSHGPAGYRTRATRGRISWYGLREMERAAGGVGRSFRLGPPAARWLCTLGGYGEECVPRPILLGKGEEEASPPESVRPRSSRRARRAALPRRAAATARRSATSAARLSS